MVATTIVFGTSPIAIALFQAVRPSLRLLRSQQQQQEARSDCCSSTAGITSAAVASRSPRTEKKESLSIAETGRPSSW